MKASDESHAEVGDRTNDAIRVDGRDLRCPRRRRGRQPRLHAARTDRVRGARRPHQHRCRRQLRRRRLLRPRGQPEDPARDPRGVRRPDAQAARRAARRGRGRRLPARPLRQLPAGPDPVAGGGRLAGPDRGLRRPHASPRGRGPARAADRVPAERRRDGGAAAPGAVRWRGRSCACCSRTPSGA